MRFKEYNGLDLVGMSASVLDKWQKEHAFEKSLELREGAPEFIFFEGPPSANGRPGIHHVMARSIKDSICRYKTQTGYQVHRRAGWDTHGLPVELGVEKMLGITKEDIGSKISVEEYNAACRKEVMKYTAEWESLTNRIGYWVDMKDPYITYDNRYIETLWYLLKKIYDKGLLYKGYTIQPYSPAAGTGLSSHELNQPGCYRDVKDTTCTAQFRITDPGILAVDGENEYYFLAWTTTPWTLPSNTALCVGPKIDYVRVLSANPYTGKKAVYVMAKALVSSYFTEKFPHPFQVLEGEFKGSDLVGIHYEQLFPWVKPCALEGDRVVDKSAEAFRVIPGDYVTVADGTGIVHIAPTFGADDAKVARDAGIPSLFIIDRAGDTRPMVDFQGKYFLEQDMDPAFRAAFVNDAYWAHSGDFVKPGYKAWFTRPQGVSMEEALKAQTPEDDLNIVLCIEMKAAGQAFKIEKHLHNYPHCWRTDLPILYYPLDSWFIRATAVKDQMVALNQNIDWKPKSTGTGRFGNWLENLNDWNLSRSRYWGTPLPVWRNRDTKEEICIGSVAELYAQIEKAVAAGVMASNPLADKGFDPADMSKENYDKIDLHRPYVDDIVLVGASGAALTREKDLIDVWFDSGAMPYAQEGLRNLESEAFGTTADFIAEGVDQTRGWFYTLHAIHTMVSGTPAYKCVISNGLVLDKFGNKMSKRLGNAVDPFEMLDKYGADAIRWYMLTNAQPWDNLKFDEAGVDEVRRKFFGTLYNSYSLFAVYANIDDFDPSAEQVPYAQRPEFDRWMDSRLNTLVKKVEACYEDYDVTTAGRLIQEFVCDDFSNWYIRLNKKRMWASGMNQDKISAYQTMYNVLRTVALLSAPIAPFFSDRIWMDLGGEDSVHFQMMPKAAEQNIDTDLEERMALAQKSCSLVLGLRKKVAINVKKPLPTLMIPVVSETVKAQLDAVKQVILTEVNVKEMKFITDTAGVITKKIKPNFKTLGKIYGPRMKEIAAAFQTMDQNTIAAIERSQDSYTLALAGGDVVLSKTDYEINSEDMPGWLVASEGPLTIALDITLTPELIEEGTARELIRPIQNLRKSSGFDVTDRIVTVIYAQGESAADIKASLAHYKDYVASQTLSLEVSLADMSQAPAEAADVEWGDDTIKILVTKNR